MVDDADTFSVDIVNVDCTLQAVAGLTYPHHIFGPGMVLVARSSDTVQLPGLHGEIYVARGEKYSVEQVTFGMPDSEADLWSLTHFVRATHDYRYPQHGFLPLKQDDVVFVVDEDASGWWFGINTRGERGVFPRTYATPLALQPPLTGTLVHGRAVKLALHRGIDLVSGNPLPLTLLQSVSTAPDLSCQHKVPADALNVAFLQRSECRRDVLNALRCLSSLQDSSPPSRALTRAKKPVSDDAVSSMQSTLREVRHDVKRSLVSLCRQLEAYVTVCVTAVPSASWYQTLHELLQRYSDDSHDGSASSDVLRALEMGDAAINPTPAAHARRQGDIAAVLARRHGEMQTRLLTVRAREAEYVQKKAQLLQRIDRRDAAVSRLLQDWRGRVRQLRVLYRNESQGVRQYKLNSERAREQLQTSLDVAKENYVSLREVWQEALLRQRTLAQNIRAAHDQLAVVDARLRLDEPRKL